MSFVQKINIDVVVLRTKIILMAVATMLLATAGCKKENTGKDDADKPPVITQLPASAMFVSTYDSKSGTSIYVLNASTGEVTTKYQYAYDAKAKWSAVVAGNGLLYDISANKINAINMNTGKVLWTDSVNNLAKPILHNDIFYGVSANTQGTYTIYALDATKPTKTFLWQGKAIGETRPDRLTNRSPILNYYNGVLFALLNDSYIAALDANSGTVKWQANYNSSYWGYSFASLQNGFITIDYNAIDAVSGTQINMVIPPVIPPSFPQNTAKSEIDFLTKENSFVLTRHFDASPGWSKSFLSLVDSKTGTEKWHINVGGGYVNYDSISNVTYVWMDRILMKKVSYQGAGKYGVNSWDRHWLTDINTGFTRLNIEDDGMGLTESTYIVGSTMYLTKRFESTLYGLPYGGDTPPANFFLAVDLNTGKQKWNINKLLAGYTGRLSSCLYTGGKGYSSLIQ
jgi:outer membrane protein assembly factor BamB